MNSDLFINLMRALGLIPTPEQPQEFTEEGPYLLRNIDPGAIEAHEEMRRKGIGPIIPELPRAEAWGGRWAPEPPLKDFVRRRQRWSI